MNLTGLSRESPQAIKQPRQVAGDLLQGNCHAAAATPWNYTPGAVNYTVVDPSAVVVPAKPKRKSKGTSPTQRTLKFMRTNGYLAEVVEKRLPKVFITKDLFGFIDVLAVKGEDIIGIQVTSGDHVAHRITKIIEHENYPLVIAAMRIVVHGWRKNAAGKWVLREVEL
jgi:hypothetical protein